LTLNGDNDYNRKHKRYKRTYIMKKAAYNIVPTTEEILKNMGEQIKLARLRRNLPAELVAERAGISRASLWKVESGNPAVAMGIYAAVLHALNNMDKDLLLVAKDDEFGRQMQDLNLMTRKRATRRKN
jgi:hypothetical protein